MAAALRIPRLSIVFQARASSSHSSGSCCRRGALPARRVCRFGETESLELAADRVDPRRFVGKGAGGDDLVERERLQIEIVSRKVLGAFGTREIGPLRPAHAR